MRIVGGTLRGRKIYAPRGRDTRPTSDRVREALFNILGDRVIGRRVLDLFAGTGALGLEALSRGAARAVFVDDNPRALAAIGRNIQALDLTHLTSIVKADLRRGPGPLKNEKTPFNLIFIDPPYGRGLIRRAMTDISKAGLVSADSIVIAEHSSRDELSGLPENWLLTGEKSYGRTGISIFTHKGVEV